MKPKTITKLVDKYVYFKFCWERAWTHVRIPIFIFNNLALLALVLKAYNLDDPILIGTFGFMLFFGLIWFGHIDVKSGFIRREYRILNSQNELLQELKRGNDKR